MRSYYYCRAFGVKWAEKLSVDRETTDVGGHGGGGGGQKLH